MYISTEYDVYVSRLHKAASANLNKVLDWDNSENKDVEKIALSITEDVEQKLVSGLEIPDKDIQVIKACCLDQDVLLR